MATKTEEYLRILAEGGDAPTSCCMTNEQKLIAEAIDRINHIAPGGDGTIEPLANYLDPNTLSISDVDGLISAIEDGKGFYLDFGDQTAGMVADGIYGGSVTNTEIILSSTPLIVNVGTTAQPRYTLQQLNLHFDKTTGVIDPTDPTTAITYPFGKSTETPGTTLLSQGTLTINIGQDTYTYDGSTDTTITILNGENMGF